MPDRPDIRFALNQRTAPNLSFPDFLDLAVRLGCIGVEVRTDLGRLVFDGLQPTDAGRIARERGLRIVGLSEVYPFDDWTSERRDAVASLIATACEAGAETVSLIPRVDSLVPDMPERAQLHRDILGEVLDMRKGTAVVPLVEPIGFSGASIRYQREAVAAITDLGAQGQLGILHDTFQHALARDDDFLVQHIRLVHISGLSQGSGTLTEADDGARVLIDEDDRTATVDQIRTLRTRGYQGPFSFECTAPAIQTLPDPLEAIAACISHIRERLAVTFER